MMLTFSALIFALNINAQSSSSNLPPCQGANTAAWNQCFGTKNYPNGDKYVGEWIGGKASGQGTYTSKASAAMYSGQFAADTFSGAGAMTWTNGAKFIGQWKNDSAVSGTITYANGTSAIGTIRNAVFYASAQQPQAVATQQPSTIATQQPQAVANQNASAIPQIKLPPCSGTDTKKWNMCVGTFDNFGESYIGEWKNGKYHGQGKLNTASGRVQAGEFKDGEYIARQTVDGVRALLATRKRDLPPCQGSNPTKFDMCFGTFAFSEGVNYVGEWEKGMASGQGVRLLKSGARSEGNFVEGELNGQGIFISADGKTTVVGEFKDDKGNGMVTVISPNGEYVGQAKDNFYHGEGRLTSKKGDVIVGEFINGLPDGPISASMSDGEKYVGQMKEGEYDGYGELTRADGTKYAGFFKGGGYHGKGTLVTAKGEKFVGEFKDGEYVSTQAKQNVANKIIDTTNARTIRGSCHRVTQMLPEYDLDINLYARIRPENERLGKLLSSLSSEGWTSGERNYGDGYAFTANLCQGGSGSWRKNCTSADLRREYDKCVALYR